MGVRVYHAPAVGFRGWLRRYWGTDCAGPFGPTYHNAMKELGDRLDVPVPTGVLTMELYDSLFGAAGSHPAEVWPTACERCGVAVPNGDDEIPRQVFVRVLHQTREGLRDEQHLPAGAAFWAKWKHEIDDGADRKRECFDRDVCDPRGHLHVALPDGVVWDVHGRANNCTMRDERTHYCWVLHGDLEAGTLHVDKGGNTCAAGAGSIATSGYHGFLQHGELVSC